MLKRLLGLPAALLVAAAVPTAASQTGAAPTGAAAAQGTLELIETFPVETTLDQPDLREAYAVWPELIDAARERIDCAWFYVSDEAPSRLSPFIEALERAADRGVAVRILADQGFHETYPEPLDALGARDHIELRLFDVKGLTGGVLHAKYFLVDERITFLGSQNCDWRSLEHIQELGLLIDSQPVQRAFREEFEADWARAIGETPPVRAEAPGRAEAPEQELIELSFGDAKVQVRPVASPGDWVDTPGRWDLPHLLALIDGAERSVRVQLLTYRSRNYDGSVWGELEQALERAAARGVQVELLVADWGKRKSTIGGLQRLVQLENFDVRMVAIPAWSEGFVPFGRVIHSKYAVADGNRAWLGTSNWERGYFYASRNLGLMVEGQAFGERLDHYFESGWNSAYAEPVDPDKQYKAPRIGP